MLEESLALDVRTPDLTSGQSNSSPSAGNTRACCDASFSNSKAHRNTATKRPFSPPSSISSLATMFRTALLRSTRCLAQASTRAHQPAIRRVVASPFVSTRISSPAVSISAVRCYASASGLGQEEVTGRILDLLKNFDKVCFEQAE